MAINIEKMTTKQQMQKICPGGNLRLLVINQQLLNNTFVSLL